MYGRDSCVYTVRMKNQLQADSVDFAFVDVETPEGAQRYAALGVEGVPAFECNGRTAVGYMPTESLMQALGKM